MTVRLAQIGVGHVHAPGRRGCLRTTPGAELVGVFEPDDALRRARTGVAPYDGLTWFSSSTTCSAIRASPASWWRRRPSRTSPGPAGRWRPAGKHVHLDKAPGTSYAAFAEVIEACPAPGAAVPDGLSAALQHRRRVSVPGLALGLARPGAVGTWPGSAESPPAVRLLPRRSGALAGRDDVLYRMPPARPGHRRAGTADGGAHHPPATIPVPDPIVDSTVTVLEFPAAGPIETTALEVRPVESAASKSTGAPAASSSTRSSADGAAGARGGARTVRRRLADGGGGDPPRYEADMAELVACIASGAPPAGRLPPPICWCTSAAAGLWSARRSAGVGLSVSRCRCRAVGVACGWRRCHALSVFVGCGVVAGVALSVSRCRCRCWCRCWCRRRGGRSRDAAG